MEGGEEFSGRTVDEAIQQARAALGPDVEIEVVAQGSRGVFGIGAEPARILARTPAPVPVGAVGVETPVAEATVGPAVESVAPDETSVAEKRAARDLATEATEVLTQLLRAMGFDAEVDVQSTEEPLTLAVRGDNLGVLIGRRGDNLSALQFMVNLILSKNRRQWPRVVLDVENYRARREQSLRTLADRMAYRVRRNGRPFTLEAMPASDRRVIHLALRDRSDVETYSIGEGPSRRVVIAPKRAGAR